MGLWHVTRRARLGLHDNGRGRVSKKTHQCASLSGVYSEFHGRTSESFPNSLRSLLQAAAVRMTDPMAASDSADFCYRRTRLFASSFSAGEQTMGGFTGA